VVSQLDEDNYVTEAIFCPSVWPAAMLGGSIPEYTGTGYLYELFVTHPNMSYRFSDIRNIIVSIYDYEFADVLEYIEGLDGFINDEVKEKELIDTYPSKTTTLTGLRFFKKDDCSLVLLLAEDMSGGFLQFNVTFEREPYVLDAGDIGQTRLQNVVERAENNAGSVSSGLKLDEHTDSNVDELGRQVDIYIHPSKWPKDVFGDLIPVYEGDGFLVDMVVSTPHAEPSKDKALIVSLYIQEFKFEDIEEYVRKLTDFGYQKIAPEDYGEQDAALSKERDAYHVFNLPGHYCFVGTLDNHGTEQLQITLRFDGRYMNFFNSMESAEGQRTLEV
jgi:hypothetical protein